MKTAIKPVRIQRKRTKGFNLQEVSKSINGLPFYYVGRGKSSQFANPYYIGMTYIDEDGRWKEADREAVIKLYEKRELSRSHYIKRVKETLAGKNLVCWCKLSDSCHADLLLKIANEV